MRIKRRAFTLVELLIVIVVIGILAAMMMLSSTEAVYSAEAIKVINNMKVIKTAAIAASLEYVAAGKTIDLQSTEFMDAVRKYVNDSSLSKLLMTDGNANASGKNQNGAYTLLTEKNMDVLQFDEQGNPQINEKGEKVKKITTTSTMLFVKYVIPTSLRNMAFKQKLADRAALASIYNDRAETLDKLHENLYDASDRSKNGNNNYDQVYMLVQKL